MERLWHISPSELLLQGRLGRGAWGETQLCQWGQSTVAIKRLRHSPPAIDDYTDRAFEKMSSELRSLRHASLALFFGSGIFPNGSSCIGFLLFLFGGVHFLSCTV
jgi:hypothetical protein